MARQCSSDGRSVWIAPVRTPTVVHRGMRETGRRCQQCGYGWYAVEPPRRPPKPRWYDETGAIWTNGQARMARRVGNYERVLAAEQKWTNCPNCGSQKASTDRSPQFKPTGAIVQTPSASTLRPAPVAPANNFQAAPSRVTAPSDGSRSGWSKAAAFHGRHWRIIWGVFFFMTPLAQVGEPAFHRGPMLLDVLKILGLFAGSWAASAALFWLHIQRRRSQARESEHSAPTAPQPGNGSINSTGHPTGTSPSTGALRSSTAADDVKAHSVNRTDMNTASLSTMLGNPGMTPDLAKRIISERTANGRFANEDDFLTRSHLQPHQWAQLRQHVWFSADRRPGEPPRQGRMLDI